MAQPDNTYQNIEDLLYPNQDTAHTPLPLPGTTPFQYPQSGLCLNDRWWALVAGMLERLLYADAWDAADEEEAQDHINHVIDILDKIGQFQECATMPCTPLIECCCNTTNIFQQNDYLTSNLFQSNSFQDVFMNDFNISLALELQLSRGEIAEAVMDKIITDQMICTASHLFFAYLHDIGMLSNENLIEHNPAFQLFREVNDIIFQISAAASVVASIFPGAQPAVAPLAVLSMWTAFIDDAVVLLTAELFSEIDPAFLSIWACKLYEAMVQPGAGLAEFQAASFDNPTMDSYWDTLATPELYGAWLALLDNEDLNLDFDCCTNCEVFYPTHHTIIHGIPNNADSRVLQTVETGSGSSLTKQATVQIDFDTPRQVRKVSVWTIGQRYNPLGLNFHIRSKRDSEGYVEMVHSDGSAWVNADLNEANVYFAPESQVNLLNPTANSWTINIVYASCQACDSSQLANYANAYGLMFAITICWD